MSEYQYYEFLSIDDPLTPQAQKSMAALSSRANVTSHTASYVYHYSDFRGDPEKLLLKYFDAMIYVTNWGSNRLIFKFPKNLIDPKKVKTFCIDDIITLKKKTNFYILDLDFNDERGGGWTEGEGWLSSLSHLRSDIMVEDYRLLYLAWIKAKSLFDEEFSKLKEPPIPGGLKSLSRPLEDFIELFEIDKDDVKMVQKKSTKSVTKVEKKLNYKSLLTKLSIKEKDDFLLRLANRESNMDIKLINKLNQVNP